MTTLIRTLFAPTKPIVTRKPTRLGSGFDTLEAREVPAGLNLDMYQTGTTAVVSGSTNADKVWVETAGSGIKITTQTQAGFVAAKTFTGITKVQVFGDSGADTVYLQRSNVAVDVVGGAGNDTVWGGAGVLRAWGDGGEDYLVGGSNNDQLVGGSENDKIWGGGGHDTIWGEAGDDQLVGDAGNDTVHGGGGRDKMWGEAGYDTAFVNGPGAVTYGFEKVQMTGMPTDQAQNDGWSCGPNSVSRVLRWYGFGNASYNTLRSQVQNNGNLVSYAKMGTPPSNLFDVMKRWKGDTQMQQRTDVAQGVNPVVNALASGRPVVALLNVGGTTVINGPFGIVIGRVPSALHYVAVTGYDAGARTFTYTDTNGAEKTIGYDDFYSRWNFTATGIPGDFLTGTLGVKQRTIIY